MVDWDRDIAAFPNLTDAEKDGLQVYRTFGGAFESARLKQFSEAANCQTIEVNSLRQVLELVAHEEVRFVPVVSCAFADDELKNMFKRFLPSDIPGGKKNMIGGFGPLATLFNRIQFAFAFDMIHSDILIALDKLRGHRNAISHTWNPAEFSDFFETPLPLMDEMEDAIIHRLRRQGCDTELSSEGSLRVRTIWMLARLFYETRFYPLAKAAQIKPFKALYGAHHPSILGSIYETSHYCTDMVLSKM